MSSALISCAAGTYYTVELGTDLAVLLPRGLRGRRHGRRHGRRRRDGRDAEAAHRRVAGLRGVGLDEPRRRVVRKVRIEAKRGVGPQAREAAGALNRTCPLIVPCLARRVDEGRRRVARVALHRARRAARRHGERALAAAAEVDARDAVARVAAQAHRAVGAAEQPLLARRGGVAPEDLQHDAVDALRAAGGGGGRRRRRKQAQRRVPATAGRAREARHSRPRRWSGAEVQRWMVICPPLMMKSVTFPRPAMLSEEADACFITRRCIVV